MEERERDHPIFNPGDLVGSRLGYDGRVGGLERHGENLWNWTRDSKNGYYGNDIFIVISMMLRLPFQSPPGSQQRVSTVYIVTATSVGWTGAVNLRMIAHATD